MEHKEAESGFELELALLRSDLKDLFVTHAVEGAVFQPDNLNSHAEYVLGGTYANGDDSFMVSVSQKVNQNGLNYLLICSIANYGNYWCLVNDQEAVTVWGGRPPMDLSDVLNVRAMLSADHSIWSRDLSEGLVISRVTSPFDWADRIAGKTAE